MLDILTCSYAISAKKYNTTQNEFIAISLLVCMISLSNTINIAKLKNIESVISSDNQIKKFMFKINISRARILSILFIRN